MDNPERSAVSAPPDGVTEWQAIDWPSAHRSVRRLQVRIAKAVREKRWGKVRSLQRILTQSLPAKRLAVRRVTTNQGKRTPGVDGVLWNTSRKKMQAVASLQRHGYQPLPLRRIYIPKRNGRRRPLSIPTMKDRAMQALHLLALEPVAETTADPNSYGFRRNRSVQDAHGQCYVVLAKSYAPMWVFDADIEACFDGFSHPWLLKNIPMDRGILGKWLSAGYLEGEVFHPIEKGTPQGGVISPMIANLALDGLEARVRSAAPMRQSKTAPRPKVHIIRYADDLMATARTRRMLQQRVIPIIGAFLKERGLNLSQEKSRIVHIKDGLEFLGANVRKYKGKLLMRPTRANVIAFTRSIKEYIQSHRTTKTVHLIHQLNRRLRGWANAFRHLVSSRAFRFVDRCVFRQLWRWARKRHGNKGVKWVQKKYFHIRKNGSWVFYARSRTKEGRPKSAVLFRVTSLRIRRHVKIQSKATVHDPAYDAYFEQRRQRQRDARQHDYYRWLDYQRLEWTA